MKPHVICHMVSSVDGRTLNSRWRPDGKLASALFERLHDELGGDAWLIGRVTGQEFAKGKSYPGTDQIFPRENWFPRRDAKAGDVKASDVKAYGVALDCNGKITWGRSDIGGDPIVAVLSRQVSDAHLAGLRNEGVSYIFAGDTELDLGLVLEILNRELGVKRLLLEGGGGANGAFLRAGLIDELSLVLCPAVDGAKGAPSVFDSAEPLTGPTAPVEAMTLESSNVLDGGAVWLRYRLRNR
jgi:riboflavin biosynthesis pyrimidine reductase